MIKMIEDDGWYFVRASGDHHQFKHPETGRAEINAAHQGGRDK
ncbi:type II toxin-antitoxin system HicA family toxin [Saccharibacillus sp. WB 17]